MLVISRKTSESFTIGDDIVIKILEVSGDKIKIGIEAPKDVKVMRSEILETIRSNIEAVAALNQKKLDLLEHKIIKNKK
jgi:carbon storage regulator (csrA)